MESEGWTQSDARSTLGSMNGNIKIQAGNHANVLGTDMITPRTNRIDIEGASVKVEAGKDIINTSERHEYKQAGLTIAVSSPVVSTAQSMMHSIKRSGEVKNEKLKNLHQIKAAYESLELAENIKNATDTLSNLGKMEEGDISNPSVKVSVSIGASQSKQTSETKTVTHSGSELSGGTVAITSRQGDVDILGSSIHAKRAELDVAKNLNVESVQDTYQNRSENKNSGWSVGVFVGANGNSYGLGVEGSAQVGKGHENSDSITQRNSYLNAEETVIKTGQDANFKGAKVNTNRLDADIKGNLTLESRQDSNHYDSKQKQAGAGFSVAIYGSGSSASANYSQNKAKVNYAQVEEQTGFHVGEGGMNVSVGGNTHLAGAVIESEAEQGKNRFKTTSLTHSDIENRSEVEVKSISAGLSTDMAQNAKNAMAAAASALGNKHETASSQTKSAISANINIDTKTPENLTALSRDTQNANQKVKAFDLTEIKEQQEAAQVAGELFSKITGDVAKAFDFEDGSKEKIVMHAVAGALAAKVADGNVATGAAAGASSEWLNTYVADYLKEQTKDLNFTPQQKEKLRQAAQQVTALAIGAVAGAATGGSSDSIKQGALASYNAETYNRQLHQNEKERIKLLADGDEEKERRLEIAACALVHCSAQIPLDDPDYAKAYEKAKYLEQLGSTAEYAQERILLRRQTEMQLDPWGAGVENKLFEYNDAYKALDHASRFDSKYGVTTRAGGVVQAVGGVGTMVVGAGLCETGVGCVAGVPVAVYGADHAYTGAKAIVTGKNHSTLGGQLLSQVTGLSPETANLVYDLPNLYAGAKPILGATAKLGKQAVAEGSEMASAAGYVAGELAKDAKAGALAIKNAADKAYIRAQYGYVDLVDAGVNGAREYVRNGVKSMADQKREVVLANALAAGAVKSGFESYEYIVNKKPMTSENLLKSVTDIGYSTSQGAITTGMPMLPAIGLGVTVDWAKENGKYDVTKSTGSAVIGAASDSSLGGKVISPIIREVMTNTFEKFYDKGKESE